MLMSITQSGNLRVVPSGLCGGTSVKYEQVRLSAGIEGAARHARRRQKLVYHLRRFSMTHAHWMKTVMGGLSLVLALSACSSGSKSKTTSGLDRRGTCRVQMT